jgi:HEAT repeat protein
MKNRFFFLALLIITMIPMAARAIDQATIDRMVFLLRQFEWNQWGEGVFDDATLYDGLQAAYAQGVNDNDGALVRQVIWAMGETHLAFFAPTVVGALETEPVSACYSLGKLGSDTSVEALIGMLDSKDDRVRDAAAWGLGNMPYSSSMTSSKDQAVAALNGRLSVEKESWIRTTVQSAIDMIKTGIATSAAFEKKQDE